MEGGRDDGGRKGQSVKWKQWEIKEREYIGKRRVTYKVFCAMVASILYKMILKWKKNQNFWFNVNVQNVTLFPFIPFISFSCTEKLDDEWMCERERVRKGCMSGFAEPDCLQKETVASNIWWKSDLQLKERKESRQRGVGIKNLSSTQTSEPLDPFSPFTYYFQKGFKTRSFSRPCCFQTLFPNSILPDWRTPCLSTFTFNPNFLPYCHTSLFSSTLSIFL